MTARFFLHFIVCAAGARLAENRHASSVQMMLAPPLLRILCAHLGDAPTRLASPVTCSPVAHSWDDPVYVEIRDALVAL
jgi:hypothetical protein